MIIDNINHPSDLKRLSLQELNQLSTEMRQAILQRVSETGGHVGPNLGSVELTIALHVVFESPKDQIIWDVSHQAYPHKLLTGRKQGYLEPTHYQDIGGYTDQDESEHDFFKIGHTSTSISLATGLAKARDYQNKVGNVIAVIGDGSLSGGLAFEGLNNGAELDSNLIIIVNDNQMSIDENVGGLYKNLAHLRATNGLTENNFFKAMGFDYRYVANGHDLEQLLNVLKETKDINHPLILHINTEKGHGYALATTDKMAYHWRGPFEVATGELKNSAGPKSYTNSIIDHLIKKAEIDPSFVTITAAIPGMFDLKRFQKAHPQRYLDVGIAEAHSVSFAAGFAKNGMKPVLFHSSYFLPRAYDQLSHDLAVNKLPAVILVGQGDISKSDITHQGLFDIPMINSIPEINYLVPSSEAELLKMLDWALAQTEGPIAIRIPTGPIIAGNPSAEGFDIAHYATIRQGEKVALLGLGSFLPLAQTVADQLTEMGITATLIDPRSATKLDQKALNELKQNHQLVVTFEDGSLTGGFGESISRFFASSAMRTLHYGAKKEFTDNVPTAELYDRYRLTPAQILKDIKEILTVN